MDHVHRAQQSDLTWTDLDAMVMMIKAAFES